MKIRTSLGTVDVTHHQGAEPLGNAFGAVMRAAQGRRWLVVHNCLIKAIQQAWERAFPGASLTTGSDPDGVKIPQCFLNIATAGDFDPVWVIDECAKKKPDDPIGYVFGTMRTWERGNDEPSYHQFVDRVTAAA